VKLKYKICQFWQFVGGGGGGEYFIFIFKKKKKKNFYKKETEIFEGKKFCFLKIKFK